jgi:hypothetical protein
MAEPAATPTDGQQDQQTTPVQPTRLPFDAEFMRQSDVFCEQLLQQIPELNSIALIPIWNNQPENMAPGLLRLRDPSMPYLATLLQLLGRMAAFNVAVHKDLLGQLKLLDNYATELANNVRTRIEELNALNTPSENTNDARTE